MNGVGQDERARSRCHFGANDWLAEAQLAEHGCHVDPAGKTDDTENWLGAHVRPEPDFWYSSSFYWQPLRRQSVYHNAPETPLKITKIANKTTIRWICLYIL